MNARDARADVTLETARRVMQAADVVPDTLARNDDLTFTASFKQITTPEAESRVQSIHRCVVVVKQDSEVAQVRRPNVEPDLRVLVHFAFTTHPDRA